MADKNAAAQIRIIKKGRGHGGHHGGAWKVAYADFVTAMMAFFLVMWIVGLNTNIKQAIAGYFKDPVGFMKEVRAGNSPFKVPAADGKPGGSSSQIKTPENDAQERGRLAQAKKMIEKMIADSPEFKDLKGYIDIKMVNEGLKIELIDAKQSLFFDSGSAHVKPATRHLLSRISEELRKLPNNVIIEGHTDNRPLARADGYTNWELSADRANSARQIMEGSGLRKNQVDQVRGYAATHPRDPKNPGHFSNRRVSIIVVMSHAMQKDLYGSSSSDDSSTPGDTSLSPLNAHEIGTRLDKAMRK